MEQELVHILLTTFSGTFHSYVKGIKINLMSFNIFGLRKTVSGLQFSLFIFLPKYQTFDIKWQYKLFMSLAVCEVRKGIGCPKTQNGLSISFHENICKQQ